MIFQQLFVSYHFYCILVVKYEGSNPLIIMLCYLLLGSFSFWHSQEGELIQEEHYSLSLCSLLHPLAHKYNTFLIMMGLIFLLTIIPQGSQREHSLELKPEWCNVHALFQSRIDTNPDSVLEFQYSRSHPNT